MDLGEILVVAEVLGHLAVFHEEEGGHVSSLVAVDFLGVRLSWIIWLDDGDGGHDAEKIWITGKIHAGQCLENWLITGD